MKKKLTLFHLLFAVCTNINITANAQVNVKDSLALVDLYNNTNDSGWIHQDNWLTGPVTTWYGITVEDTSVTGISMAGNNLNDSIPASLGNLVNLTGLDLSDNQLNGSIPASLGNLVNLNNLYLNNNQLSGTIPSELGNISPPWDMSAFDLSHNKLSGSIPSSLGNLNLDDFLDLSYNQLSGNIPSELGNLRLYKIDLSHNQLSGLPSFGNLNILELDLSYNQLNGSIPLQLGLAIFALNLSHNQLSGGIPPDFGNLIQMLDLSYNQLSGSIPGVGFMWSNIEYIDLSHNQLSGKIPDAFLNIPLELIYFDLSYNQLSGRIPYFGNLLPFGRNLIQPFDLSHNRFTFDGMEELAKGFPSSKYDNQAPIPVHQNGNALSVSAGGTLSKNTYTWFTPGSTINIKGDSVFHPSQSGRYYGQIRNSIATELILYTDTIDYNTLPVTITNLEAHQQGSIVKVDWISLAELNIVSYEIQHALNALGFTTVGKLPAKGNGLPEQNYSFNHLQPQMGNNYYRLKVFDRDGKITYSNTVLVNITNGKAITVVYPIPAKDILYVKTNGNASFSLVDQSGQTLLTTNINGKGSINISGMAAGLYYLINNSTGAIQKVIISR